MAKIVLTNISEEDRVISIHGGGLISIPAGGTKSIVLNPAKDMGSKAYYKKFYDSYLNNFNVEYDIDEYPLDVETITVTYIIDEDTTSEEIIYSGSTVPVPENPEKENNTFLGWYADEDRTVPFDFTVQVEDDCTVYAKWAENPKCKVTFESNGGSSVDEQELFPGEKVTKPANPTKEGFTFAGWYADEDCNNAYDFSVSVVSSITIYAKWNEAEAPAVTSGAKVTPKNKEGGVDSTKSTKKAK